VDNTNLAAKLFDEFADEYQAKFMNVSFYSNSLDIFCNSISKPNAILLDVACGPGNITQYLLQNRNDFKITGIDLAPKMLDFAKNNNPWAQFKLMDGRDILKLEQQFDGIMCGFLLPYLNKQETKQFIADASEILNSSGILYISTMEEDENHQSGIKRTSAGDELFMHYHNANTIIAEIKNNNLKIIEIQRKESPEADGKVTDLIIIAKKEETN
jgi:2-polyprenyl-3-methyl-5-hydroxy-6-metoxy-1,4-benzoquinol methylase